MEIEADLASATALYTMSSTVDGQQQHAALTAPSTPPPSYAPTDIPRHPATRLPTPTKARAKARERTRARVVVVAQDPATPPLASAPVSGWCSNLAILLQPVDGLHLHVARTAIFSDAATSTTCVPGYTEALCPPPPRRTPVPFTPNTSAAGHTLPLVAVVGDLEDQQSLANSCNAMVVTPPTITDWVADSGASNQTTPNASNLRTFQPFNSTTLHLLLMIMLPQ
jgi:hypothetical protein